MSVNSLTPEVSTCQKATFCPSGLKRQPSRSPSSSSYTQSNVPFTSVAAAVPRELA